MNKLLSRCRQKRVLIVILSVMIVGLISAGIAAAAKNSGAGSQEPSLAAAEEPSLFPDCKPETDPEKIAEFERIMSDFQQKTSNMTNNDEIGIARDELMKLLKEKKLFIPIMGPEAKGIRVTIAGKTIQLPPDAYVAGESLIEWYALPGMSEEEIRRMYDNKSAFELVIGDSHITIGIVTGDILMGKIAPGNKGVFDFLKEVFPEQSAAIDALPILSSDTSSMEVTK